MKRIVSVLVLLTCLVTAADRVDNDAGAKYVTCNPLAPFTYINDFGAKFFLPIISNMEYGLSVHSAYLITPSQAADVRLVLGGQNQMNFTPQIHVGYNFFILDEFDKTNKGLYVGADLRLWDSYNNTTSVHLFTLAPSLRLGYWLEIKRVVFDLRVNQIFAFLSWTSKEHVNPSFELDLSPVDGIPVLPFASINLGWKF